MLFVQLGVTPIPSQRAESGAVPTFAHKVGPSQRENRFHPRGPHENAEFLYYGLLLLKASFRRELDVIASSNLIKHCHTSPTWCFRSLS